MKDLDILFIGAVMNYDGSTGSLANYIRKKGKWMAPFQYIYDQHRELFTSEADACVYDIPNLSICELVDYLKRHGELEFHIIWHFDYHKEEILEIFRTRPPKIIAVSSTLAFFPEYLKSCIHWLNTHKPAETRVAVGGKWLYANFSQFGPSNKFEKTLTEVDADYYVINRYGQETLRLLLAAHKTGDTAAIRDLPNLAYRRSLDLGQPTTATHAGADYIINPVITEAHEQGKYLVDFHNIGERFLGDIVHVRTASSCPFHCRFCTFPALAGEYVAFGLDLVIAQLKQLKSLGVKKLFFIDDTFNVPLKRFEELLDRMIAENLELEWVSFFRAQYSTAEVVKKMRDAGCRMVFCGIESGNDEILKAMNKRVTVADFERGFDFLHRAGITIAASYFIGYPGETHQTAMDTLRLLNDPRIAFSRGSVFYYDPNAPVGAMAEEYGLSGNGAEWRHNTMSSREAAQIHLEIVDKIQNVNVQISDGAGWSVFHLYSKGLSIERLQTLYTEFNTIQKEQIQGAGRTALSQYRVFGKKRKEEA
ncbi:MAG: radical SAM protein [Proteobacteria bacterium]|nr:radical SAM protein [Desulfobulbaceae bacterium]MBU4152220.1 radical SAM protein [Pseudomonadota bacterium]